MARDKKGRGYKRPPLFDPKDPEDALVDALILRDVMEDFEQKNPGSIDFSPYPEPDREQPGRAMREQPGIAEAIEKGGTILVGDVDCSRCNRTFYIEVAFDAENHILHSLGGVLHPNRIILCDECSPF